MIFDTDIFIWVQRGNKNAARIIEADTQRYSLRHPILGTLARTLSPDAALLVVVGSGPTASSRLASDKMARTPESSDHLLENQNDTPVT